ncbi:MAG: transglutaminase family protein [Candidatus Aminicenantia bacterium]
MKQKKFIVFCAIWLWIANSWTLGKNYVFKRNYFILSKGEKIGYCTETVKKDGAGIQYNRISSFANGDKILINSFLRKDLKIVSYTMRHFINGHHYDIKITSQNDELLGEKHGNKRYLSLKSVPLSLLHFWVHEKIKRERLFKEIYVQVIDERSLKDVTVKIVTEAVEPEWLKLLYIFPQFKIFEEWDRLRELSFLRFKDIILISEELIKERKFSFFFKEQVSKKQLIPFVKSCLNSKFFLSNLIYYKVSIPDYFFLPSDNRQKIIEEFKKEEEKITVLKIKEENILNFIRECEDAEKKILNYYSSDVSCLTFKITEGIPDTNKKVWRIFNWISHNINKKENAIPVAEVVLKNREGECQGISNLFVAMCKIAGVEAKAILGIVISIEEEECKAFYHQWVEVFVDGNQIDIDPTLGIIGVPPNYIKIKTIETTFDYASLYDVINKIKIQVYNKIKNGEEK